MEDTLKESRRKKRVKTPEYILSTENVEPILYKIRLQPEVQSMPYTSVKGHVEITLKIKKTTAKLTLHSMGIQILCVKFINESGQLFECINYQYNTDLEIFDFHFEPGSVSGNEGTLLIDYYTAPPSEVSDWDKRNGLLIRPYISEFGKRFAFFTQMEPCNARQLFPCWDQPATKSKFKIELVIPTWQTAVSNMPVESINSIQVEEDIPEFEDFKSESIVNTKRQKKSIPKQLYIFQITPYMSTYLIGIAIGEFHFLEKIVQVKVWPEYYVQDASSLPTKPVILRIYTPIGRSEEGRFALDIAEKVFCEYTDRFQMTNPLDKLDLVSVDGLSVLGMENWGMMTFSESYILVNANTPFHRKQRIARLVCHEIAHQWFGNLATMAWWKYLWLKEGLVRYLEYSMINTYFPEWHYWTHFLKDIYQPSLDMDCSLETHPIEVNVTRPAEIKNIFDSLSYGKGACVARMVGYYLGDDVFWKGIQMYIKAFQYSNAVTEDLWNSFSKASNTDISAVMNDWVQYAGHPILKIECISYDSASKNAVYEISQYLDGSSHKNTIKINDKGNPQYVMPLCVKQKNKEVHKLIVRESVSQVTLNKEMNDWVNFNYNKSGYCRVMYSPEMWEQLGNAVANSELPLDDAFGLLLDIFTLFEDKYISLSTLLHFLVFYKTQSHSILWEYISDKLLDILLLSTNSPWFNGLQRFILDLLQYEWQVIFNPDTEYELVKNLCNILYVCEFTEDIKIKLKNTFEEWVKGASLPLQVLRAVLDMVIAFDDAAYDIVVEQAMVSKSTSRRKIFFLSLWRTKNEDRLIETVVLYTENQMFKDLNNDISEVLTLNPLAREIVWRRVKLGLTESESEKQFFELFSPLLLCLLPAYDRIAVPSEQVPILLAGLKDLQSAVPSLQQIVSSITRTVCKNLTKDVSWVQNDSDTLLLENLFKKFSV